MEIDEVGNGPVIKRQKLANGIAKSKPQPGASRIFAPYRTVGLVSPTSVPFTTVPLGKTTFQITTSVGRSLQTYDLRKGLNLVFITRPQTPEIITASAAWKDKVIAAYGGDGAHTSRGVWAFKRGKKEAELELPEDWTQNVKSFCVFGSWIVGVCETQLLVWKTTTLELHAALQSVSPVPFSQCISSLPTYLNTILVGRQDGSAEIWNVSSGKLVYTILPPSTAYGAVTAIQPTPALSLVAIAYEKGPLLIHDIRADQTVIHLNTPAGAPVHAISFRTDGIGAGEDGRQAGVMVTASANTGDLTLWDLNEGGRKAGVMRAAHAHPTSSTPGGVSKIEFLSGQAILVSSGLDNSLKTWIFDETPFSPIPRILHSRSGHGAPVTKLEFLPSASDGSDDTGKWLMSGSLDRSLWGWSLRRDGQSTELSQGSVQKKAKKKGLLSEGNRDSLNELKCPPITAIACSLNRDGGIGAIPGKQSIWQGAKGKQVSAEVSGMTGWESVVTAHENDKKARTWFWGRKRAGRWAFDTTDGSNVTSVAMSACGTFAVVGSAKGGIDMFNMQSGLHRQRYPARLTPLQARQLKFDLEKHGVVEEDDGKKKFYRGLGKHGSAVVGLATDNLNKTIVSAGKDGKVKFWDFTTGLLAHEIDWSVSCGISALRFHQGSDLAALACTDGCLRVVDISTQRLIREMWPSRPVIPELANLPISDLSFSNDGHWIIASIGPIVLLWDLPTGHLVDAFKLPATCTGLAFSPTAEFLATATATSHGVDIWTNRALFSHISIRHLNAKDLSAIVSGAAQAPTASGEGGKNLLTDDEAEADAADADLDLSDPASLTQLSTSLLTLSLVPRSRWQNLLHLDLLRARNAPVAPPQKPKQAPFFLPSLSSTAKPTDNPNNALNDPTTTTPHARITTFTSTTSTSNPTTTHLTTFTRTLDPAPLVAHLASLPPAAADIEIRSLRPSELEPFVRALTAQLRARVGFELVQAWMAVVVRVHGDVLVGEDGDGDGDGDGVREAVEVWLEVLVGEKARVGRLVAGVGGLVGWLGGARV